MNHGSLFSGIGGFDLAAEWMGWSNLFHCEWNPFGQKVLHHYWPNAEQFTDITESDFTKYANKIDILTGGFPCQPYSAAGKRLGKEDERHLWPEMLRAIREIKPRWVVGENVLGLVNWNGGMVFEEVQADLEAEGYQVQPYILPACAKNAPHRRDRVWFVAYGNCDGQHQCNSCNEIKPSERGQYAQRNAEQSNGNGNAPDTMHNGLHDQPTTKDNEVGQDNIQSREQRICTFKKPCNKWDAPDTTCKGLQRRQDINQWEEYNSEGRGNGTKFGAISQTNIWKSRSNFQNFPTQSPICGRNDGIPTKLDGITFPKWRNESIKAYGNAIVPQVALEIFKTIEKYEEIK